MSTRLLEIAEGLHRRASLLVRSLREAGHQSFGEWAGAEPYERAFLIRRGDRWTLQSTAAGIGDPNFPPFAAHIANHDRWLDEVLSAADEVIDVAAAPAVELAALVDANQDELVDATASDLDMAVRFFVEPSLQVETLRLQLSRRHARQHRGCGALTLVDLFPWSAPNILGLMLDWAAAQGARRNRESDGVGVAAGWCPDLRRRTASSDEILSWREGAYARWRTMGPTPKLFDALCEKYRPIQRLVHATWDPSSPCTIATLTNDGLYLVFEAEQFARARVADSPECAARVARHAVNGYGSDAPEFEAAMRSLVREYLTERQSPQRDRSAFPESAERVLTDAVRRELAKISEQYQGPPEGPAIWDEALALHFEQADLPDTSTRKAAADSIRRSARERQKQVVGDNEQSSPSKLWKMFANPTRPLLANGFLYRTIDLVWSAAVAPTIQENEHRLCYPAMPRGVQITISELRNGAAFESTTDGVIARSAGGSLVATYAAISTSNIPAIRRGAEHMHKGTTEKIVRYLARSAHQQAVAGVNPCTRIVIRGGKDALGRQAGIADKNERARLGDYLETMQAYRGGRRDLPPLLNYWETKSAPGRSSELRIDVGEALAPGYVLQMKNAGDVGPAVHLLPVLPTPSLPSLVNNTERARLYDLQWEMLAAMRRDLEGVDRGWELVFLIDQARDKAAVTEVSANLAISHWLTGEGAWLRKLPGGDRVTLVDQSALALFRNARAGANAKAAAAQRRAFARRR